MDGHTDLSVRSFMRYNSFSALVSLLSQVKLLSPFLFSNFDELDHQSLRQMGEGYVYICSEVSHTPLSRGPSLIRGWPPPHHLAMFKDNHSFLFLIFGLAASRCQHGSVKWLFEKITRIIILNRQSKKNRHFGLLLSKVKWKWRFKICHCKPVVVLNILGFL